MLRDCLIHLMPDNSSAAEPAAKLVLCGVLAAFALLSLFPRLFRCGRGRRVSGSGSRSGSGSGSGIGQGDGSPALCSIEMLLSAAGLSALLLLVCSLCFIADSRCRTGRPAPSLRQCRLWRPPRIRRPKSHLHKALVRPLPVSGPDSEAGSSRGLAPTDADLWAHNLRAAECTLSSCGWSLLLPSRCLFLTRGLDIVFEIAIGIIFIRIIPEPR